jgi:proline iminopeptidase
MTTFYRIYGFIALCLVLSSADLCATHQLVNKLYKEQNLYPQIEPFNEGFLQVSDGHSIYFAEFGNPQGIPVITLHGGPGSQCFASWTNLFNTDLYHVIMFDQRGAGRSVPFASMENNSPHYSIQDIEQLRHHLGVDKWILFGGSCGSFLALLYGEKYPENCLGFVLRGIYLGRECDSQHLIYGMRQTHPEAWHEMVQIIPMDEQHDLISALHRRVMDPDPEVHLEAARAFMRYDTICATLIPNTKRIDQVDTDIVSTLGIGRAYIHYAANGFFIEENQILNDLHKISHLPAIIVQGRYDVICPPQGAFELYQNWPQAELWYVSDAGHATNEFGISQGLKDAMDRMVGEVE